MTARPIDVWFEEGVEDGALVRRLVFDGVDGPGGPRAVSWWRLPGITNLPLPPVLDSFVAGHVQWASMLGQDLVVHGPMSRGGLYNLGQLGEIRHALSPERYRRPIAITPDAAIAAPRPAGDPGLAIATLSGGLDSTFTAVRHARRLIGDAALPLAGLVMVHGFDAQLDQPERFDVMRRRAEPLVRLLDLPLHVVVTNSAQTGGRAWPQSAMPLFGGVLAQFSVQCAVGLMSAGAPDGTPRFGISHPTVLDQLASNEYFQLVSDGGGFGRAEKIETLAPFPDALAGLKVCWQGRDAGRNCGVCEKCVMTRLNFLAARLPDPPCFDTPLAPSHIAALPLPSLEAVRDLFRNCWNELDARGVVGPEMALLTRRLARVPPERTARALRHVGQVVRHFVPSRLRHAIHQRLPPALRP